MLLVILRPFSVGDDIELPSESVHGRVVDINFFFTTLITHDGKMWRVPNNIFFQKVLKLTKGQERHALAQQLNCPDPAKLPPPPKPDPVSPEGDKPLTPASEDFAAQSIPDPNTLAPRR